MFEFTDLPAAAGIPDAMITSHLVATLTRRLMAGGEPAVRDFVASGCSVGSMSREYMGREFMASLTADQVRGICYVDLPETEVRNGLTIKHELSGGASLWHDGKKLGQAVTIKALLFMAKQRFPFETPLVAPGDLPYFTVSDAAGAMCVIRAETLDKAKECAVTAGHNPHKVSTLWEECLGTARQASNQQSAEAVYCRYVELERGANFAAEYGCRVVCGKWFRDELVFHDAVHGKAAMNLMELALDVAGVDRD